MYGRNEYSFIHFAESTEVYKGKDPGLELYLSTVKRRLRKINKASTPHDDVIIKADFETVLCKVYIGECDSLQEADDWFKAHDYLDSPRSPYDCTGKWFTNSYHIYKNSLGEYWAYHLVVCDC